MISIIIPLYNKEHSIQSTLESIFKQTFQEYEIIIVNDGSTDNSVDVVNRIEDKRIRLIHQQNQGVSAARNHGIKEAKYNYIAFLDADDIWLPGYLAAQVELIVNFSECKVYACAYSMCDSRGNFSAIILNKMLFRENVGIVSNYFEVASCSHPPLWTSAVVVEKEAIESIGGFPLGIKAGEDLLTWARLAIKYNIAFCCESLAIYNFPENVRMREPRTADEDIVFSRLLDLYHTVELDQKSDFRKYIGRWNEMRTTIFIDSNKRKNALRPFWRMIKYKGIDLKALFLFMQIVLPFRFQGFFMRKLKSVYQRKTATAVPQERG